MKVQNISSNSYNKRQTSFQAIPVVSQKVMKFAARSESGCKDMLKIIEDIGKATSSVTDDPKDILVFLRKSKKNTLIISSRYKDFPGTLIKKSFWGNGATVTNITDAIAESIKGISGGKRYLNSQAKYRLELLNKSIKKIAGDADKTL